VGPDNGVFARATEGLRTEVFEIDMARLASQNPVSATFHGRDVFAPAVAALAMSGDPGSLAHPVAALMPGRTRAWRARDFVIEAGLVWVDRFGNCITDVPAERLPPHPKVLGEGFEIQGLHRTYADGPAGEPLAYVGSNGTLELAVPSGRADTTLGLAVGHRLRIEADDGGPW
jgi:S-adenosylmethionine hydrolase